MSSTTSEPQLSRFGEPSAVESALLVLLTLPWVAHALVTGLSAVGAHPLGSRSSAVGILVASGAAAGAVVRMFGRARVSVSNAPLPGSVRGLSWSLAVGGLSAFCGALALSFAFPVVAYDAIAYRLPTIASWLDAGRVAWLVTDDAVRNGYPLGQEAVSAVLVAATGSMRFAVLTSFFHVAAGALSIWVFAERIGVRRELARLGAALFVLVPMVILNAPSGYVDASFAGASVACLTLSALVFASARVDFALAVAAGMATAHTLSLKGTGAAIVLAVSGAVAGAFVAEKLGTSSRVVERPFARVAIVTAFALPGAFWLLRNVAHTGNPLWPVDVRVAGHELFAGVASMESVLDVAHNTPAVLQPLSEPNRLFHTWFELKGPAMDFDDRLAGLGLAWPLVAIPAVVLVLSYLSRADVSRERRRAVGIAFAATALAFVIQPMRWWPRYTIWVWGAGAIAIALVGEAWLAAGRRRAVTAALTLVTALALVEAGVGLFHADGLAVAMAKQDTTLARANDARVAPNAVGWVDAAFWTGGAVSGTDVCRGTWKPGTDDANLDGVFAQLSPRPRVHVVSDDDGDWSGVQKAWRDAGCTELLLLRGSPVLPLAQKDPEVTVEAAVAFDPLYVVRPRRFSRLALRNVTP